MASKTSRTGPFGNTAPPIGLPIGHVERDKDYAITGIELCDLLSIAHELETTKHLPAEMRGTIARQMRLILARARMQAKSGPVGRRPA